MASFDEDEVLGKAYDRRLMSRLLAYLRPYRRLVGFSIVFLFGGVALELVQPYLVKLAIDNHIKAGEMAGIRDLALLYLGCLIGAFIFRYAELYVMNLVGQRVMYDLRMQIFAHVTRLNVRFFTRNPVGRLMTRVTGDVDVLNEMFTAGVVAVIEDVLKLIGIMAILIALDWRLALATFSVLPFLAFTAAIFRARVRQTFRLVRTAIAKINAFLQENLVVDLVRGSMRLRPTINWVPLSEDVFVEITSFNGASPTGGQTTLRTPFSALRGEKEVRFDAGSGGGAVLKVQGGSSQLQLGMTVQFSVATQKNLTLMTKSNLKKSANEASKNAAALNSQMALIDKEIRSVKKSYNYGPMSYTTYKRKMSALERQEFTTKNYLSTVQSALQQLSALEKLYEQMHNTAKMHFRIYRQVGDHQVELVRSGDVAGT